MIGIGPLPPPLHGNSLVTRNVQLRLTAAGAITWVDTSGDDLQRSVSYAARRLWRLLQAAALLLSRPGKNVYLVCDAGSGMWATLALVALAAVSRHRLWLHHHSWSYMDGRRLAMRLIAAVPGDIEHVVLADSMVPLLRKAYPSLVRISAADNAVHCDDQGPPVARPARGVVCLGHLSNLSIEKGTLDVLRLFEHLSRQGHSVRLVLAGPVSESVVSDRIAECQREFGDRVEVRGSVYGDDKRSFFQSIDLFVFPSRYRHEAYPMVLLEALSAGVPCLASERGLIAEVIGDAGASCPLDAMPDAACTLLAEFTADPETWRARARCRFESLRAVGEAQLTQLVRAVAGS